jgi:drug/metabolite transporter (DMT)-like permease
MTARERHVRGAVWMCVSATLFAFMVLFARLAGSRLPWPMVGAARCIVGAAVAVIVARLNHSSLRTRGSGGVWLRSILGTVSTALSFYVVANGEITIGDAATLFALSPIFAAALAPLVLRERASRIVRLALPLSLAGVVLLTHPRTLLGAALTLTGAKTLAIVAAIGAAIFHSASMLMLRRAGRKESAEAIVVHFSVTAAIVLALLALPSLRMPSAREAAWLFSSGVSAGFAQLALTRAYALEKAALVGGYRMLEVVVASLLGMLMLGERPDLWSLTGIALILGSSVLLARRAIRPPSPLLQDQAPADVSRPRA